MTKHMNPADLDSVLESVSFANVILQPVRKKHGQPFNKRPEGYARRQERRNKERAKWAHLEG